MENTLISQVEKALYQLYNDPTQSDIYGAEKWLIQVQQSPEAWNIAWQLLQKESLEKQNFGALLLQNKISKYWSELPQEQYEPLRLELFKAILRYSSGPKLVLTRLCVAMVMYMFHAVPTIWPNAIVSIITSLRNSSTHTTIALLELLKILPEEFDRTNENIFMQKRVIIRNEICASKTAVFGFLEQLLSIQNDTDIKLAIIKCVTSWVSFCPPLPELRSLIILVFQNITDNDLMSDTVDSLTKLITHEDSYKYPNIIHEFLIQLLHLGDFINSQLLNTERDMDVCCSLCYLATDIMDNNMSLFMNISEESAVNSEESMDALQLLLSFTVLPGSYPVDEKCSDITLPFWENFMDRLASEESNHYEFLIDFYGGIVTSLIEAFPIKSQYPTEDEWINVWDEIERDDFMKYREELCDLGDSIQRTLHSEYFQHLTVRLSQLLLSDTPPPWQAIESILFLLQGAASNITDKTSSLFRNILSLFPRMTPHNTLVKTALRLLGYLSDWFREQPDVLQAVLPMILDGLSQPSVAASASLTFRDICGECSHLLAPVVVQVIPACQASLSNPDIPADQCVSVIAAVGCVLSTLPLSSLSEPLESLITSRVESLQSLAMQQPNISTHQPVLKELYILSSLCHHIYPKLQDGEQHPIVVLLLRLWPSLKTLLSKWIGDIDVVNTICMCLRRALKTTQYQYLPLLEESVQLILQCFSASHHAGLLHTTEELIKQFGCNESCHNLLSSFLQQILSLSLQLCQHGLNTVDPDIIQALLNLLSQTLLSCPVLLVNIDGMVMNCYNLGKASLLLPEHQSIVAGSSLLVTIVNVSPSIELVNEVVSIRGKDLVESILKGIAGDIDRSELDVVSNILSSLLQYYVTELAGWIEELLSQRDFPTAHPTEMEKQLFKQTILRERGNRKILKDKVKEFSLTCRGFHGTLYAAETSSRLT